MIFKKESLFATLGHTRGRDRRMDRDSKRHKTARDRRSKRHKTGADRSDKVQEIEGVEAQGLVGVLNSLVRGMTGVRFGVREEAAVHCDEEQLREAIDAWQAIVAIEVSRMSPQ